MSFVNAFFRGLGPREQALDEARASGRLGATRLPLALAADESLTDTFVGKLHVALNDGREQKARDDAYMIWLAANADRLGAQVSDSGCEDGGAWLRHQYAIETGTEP